jgi:hypothetical protein
MSTNERLFSDEEVALILRKATQLEGPGGALETGDGLSLAEIQRIGREVGIRPEVVARAAALLQVDRPGRADRLLGGPAVYRAEREVVGAIAREDFGVVVDAVRRVTGESGTVSDVLNGLEWRSAGVAALAVTVRPRNGHTAVQVLANRGIARVGLYALSTMAALVAGGITGAIVEPGVAGGIAVMGAWIGAALLTARGVWRSGSARFRAKFTTLVQTVTEEVEHHAGGDK